MLKLRSPFRRPRRVRTGSSREAVLRRVHELFSSESFRPPVLPRVAAEILSLADDETTSADHFVRVIEKDPVLAGHVLRLVRSPVYAGAAPVLTLRQAAVRLGNRALRRAILEVAFSVRVFHARTFEGPMERIAQHCRATAHIAQAVAATTFTDPDVAFFCGLLHDVGYAGLLIMLAEDEHRIVDLRLAWPAIEELRHDAALRMARAWDLDPLIVEVIAQQADPGRLHLPTAAVVALASRLAEDRGYTVRGGHRVQDDDALVEQALEILDVDDDDLAELRTGSGFLLPALA